MRVGSWLLLIGSISIAAATWLYQETWSRGSWWLPYPKLSMLFWGSSSGELIGLLIAAAVFTLVGLGLLWGVPEIPRGNTVLVVVLSALAPYHIVDSWFHNRDQFYRLHIFESIMTMIVEFACLLLVWALWRFSKRSPSLGRRAVFNWVLAFYAVNLWTGSGFILEGF